MRTPTTTGAAPSWATFLLDVRNEYKAPLFRAVQDYSLITRHIFFFRLNLSCCSDITIPIEASNIKVRANLKEQIQSGKYNLGLPIVPQTFDRISVKDNKIVTQDIVTEGRKVSLREILSKMLKDHQNYMRVYSDQHYVAEKDQMLQFLKKYNEYYPHFDELQIIEIKR